MHNRFRRVLALLMTFVTLVCLFAPSAMAADTGIPYPFDDNADISSYARDAVYLCRKLNVMHGSTENGVYGFRPQDTITRQEIFRIVYALTNAGTEKESDLFELIAATSAFTDRDQIAPWALCSAGYCISMGLFVGDGAGHLNPRGDISYFEFAIVLLRVLGYTQNTLAVQSGETVAAWRARIIETARDEGLFSNRFHLNDRCSDLLTRQDAAMMISLALDNQMVYYYPISKEQYYLPCDFTLQENAFGELSTRTGFVTEVTDTETRLADGTVLPSVARLRSDRTYLGRWITYNVCEKNEMLSWVGDRGPDSDVLTCNADEVVLNTYVDGEMRLFLGSDTVLSYRAAPKDGFLVMDQTTGKTITGTYDSLLGYLEHFMYSEEPMVLYITLDKQGRIATLCGGLAAEQ